MGQVASVNELDMHLLMNHSIPGVNAGYITRHRLLGGHLRKQQQAIFSAMVAAARPDASTWPMTASQRLFSPANSRT